MSQVLHVKCGVDEPAHRGLVRPGSARSPPLRGAKDTQNALRLSGLTETIPSRPPALERTRNGMSGRHERAKGIRQGLRTTSDLI